MLPFNVEKFYIISHRKLRNISGIKFEVYLRNLYIYTIDKGLSHSFNELLKNEKVICYLDKFFLVLPKEYTLQFYFWKSLYEIFGINYEKYIDIPNNIECIFEMIKYIDNKVSLDKEKIILDFGCGSGLSALIKTDCKIIGYDMTEEVRLQAEKKGLKTIDENDLLSIPNSYFDAVFSSYVLHMAINEEIIEKIKIKMKPNAIWIANYYKGINEKFTNSVFEKEGFKVKIIEGYQERFGNFYEFRKS